MKTILFFLCAALSFGEVHERHATVHGREWTVRYDVHGCNPAKGEWQCFVAVPATMPPGQPHYSATISVFLDGPEKIQVGREFSGEWTQEGCFEDDPVSLVEKALDHDHTSTPKINGDVTATKTPSGTGITIPLIMGENGNMYITCSGSSTGGSCYPAQCRDGEVNLRPVAVESSVVLEADICKSGAWHPSQVKIGVSGK